MLAWERRFRQVLARGGPRLVLAVSGGSDSVGLLRLAQAAASELGLSLIVAHLDHGARPDSGEDAAFVEGLARDLGLPCEIGRWAPKRASHFEADARKARLAFLFDVAKTFGATGVALGHTRDDQAETVLHRIARGTGIAGLAAMRPVRKLFSDSEILLVRPLLHVGRIEIQKHLREIGQPYRVDPTNADVSRTRSRLRLVVIPDLIANLGPQVPEALANLAAQAAHADRVLRQRVRPLARRCVRQCRPSQIVLDRDALARLETVDRIDVLRYAWRQAGWPEGAMDRRRWFRLAGWVVADKSGIRFSIGSNREGVRVRTSILLRPIPRNNRRPPKAVSLEVPGVASWGSFRVEVRDDGVGTERIDRDRIVPPLTVRGPVAGEKFEPLGMNGHSMSIGAFLRGRGVPREERPFVPLLCDARGIVWVIGHRIADRVRRTETTRSLLGLRAEAIVSGEAAAGPDASPDP